MRARSSMNGVCSGSLAAALSTTLACTPSPHVLGEVPPDDAAPDGSTTSEFATSTTAEVTGTTDAATTAESSGATEGSTAGEPQRPTGDGVTTGADGLCVQDGTGLVCAWLDSYDSGARLTVATTAPGQACLLLSMATQVGTGVAYPEVVGPQNWVLDTIAVLNAPTGCTVCGARQDSHNAAQTATGAWSWNDGAVDLALDMTFGKAAGARAERRVEVSSLAPQLCFGR